MPYKKAFMNQAEFVVSKGLVTDKHTDEYTKTVFDLPVPKDAIKEYGATGFSPAHVPGHNLDNSIDFLVNEGTPVYAMADGIVVEIKDDSDVHGISTKYWAEGNYVEIMHDPDDGCKISSYYEHLKFQGVVVKPGDTVSRDQVIGFSGNTGFTYTPHLHVQVNKYLSDDINDFVTLRIRFNDFPEDGSPALYGLERK
ncbi:MAG: M23 family metallopeptidase [Candidatus Micrarchaeota archaeon]|nr:M23 family metallopeptidase [Candidatus Micrarchaeota archaeon]